MARTKKAAEPIVGLSRDPENLLTVQKSNPLFSLWQSDMTLAEFKILDTYLSRIDSHQPEKRSVMFSKGELEDLLGVTKINKVDLTKRLNNLGRFVEVEKADHKMHKVALFEEAYGEMDENGLWQVKLTCTPSAMKYIFNIEELGYLRYKLRSMTSLSSRYTYILFLYLEKNRFRKTWEEDVNTLRQILNCDAEPTYTEFKRFNDLILKKSQKELHEKSECRFSYEPIKKGRKVSRVRFTLETLRDRLEEVVDEVDPNQLSLFEGDFEEVDEKKELDSDYELFRDLLPKELTDEEIAVLRMLAGPRVPHDPLGAKPRSIEIIDYLLYKVRLMEASPNPIRTKFGWLKAVIEKDKIVN